MISCFFRSRLAALVACLGLVSGAFQSRAQNGIFADFTTSLGNFTCVLDYTNAPKAVANFVGLATGQKAWLHSPAGQVRTNLFYNGLTFHRVIANFMIQGGSVDASGADNPGYAFTDEITPALRFDGFGTLAMANSGTNSNGSQFFVAVTNASWLNDVHTIFGRLHSGSNVVHAISRVATGDQDKPLTNVVIQSVVIRRVGTAAQAFNIHAQGLPVVTNQWLKIARAGANVQLSFSNRPYADNRVFATQTLGGNWAENRIGIEGAVPFGSVLTVPASGGAGFFRLAQIQYPGSTLAPFSLAGRTLRMTFQTGTSGTLTNAFTAAGGTFSHGAGQGTITGYDWRQEPYRGFLTCIYSGVFYPLSAKLDFVSAASGRFTGSFYPYYPYDFGRIPTSGTFILSGP